MELYTRYTTLADLSTQGRQWIGNDENHRHHHGMIPRAERTVDIHLQWKSGADGEPSDIGCFRLNMPALLKSHYVRKDGPDHLRLRFVQKNGVVYIQTNSRGPRLIVGTWPSGDAAP